MKLKKLTSQIMASNFLGLFLIIFSGCPGNNPDSGVIVTCSEVSCRLACDNGFAIGDDGCEICACAEAPILPDCMIYSEVTECTEGYHWEEYTSAPEDCNIPESTDYSQGDPVHWGKCVEDTPPSSICNPNSHEDSCPDGQHCEEVPNSSYGSNGDIEPQETPPIGDCVDDEVLLDECSLDSENSCPDGWICEELSNSGSGQDSDSNEAPPVERIGVCVEKQDTQIDCDLYSEDTCPDGYVCSPFSDLLDEPSPAPPLQRGICTQKPDEPLECWIYGEDVCPVGQHCEGRDTTSTSNEAHPDPLPPMGICVDDQNVQEHCYSSEDCQDDNICTVDLGECGSLPGSDLDVCVGQCIPANLPEICEETPFELCENNPNCQLILPESDCYEENGEIICVGQTVEPRCETRDTVNMNELCSTQIDCAQGQQCHYEVCTEDPNGVMEECFGYCMPIDDFDCIEVLQPALSPNGYCVVFPTPCEVPENWTPVDNCD